jgi:hypothetical protein
MRSRQIADSRQLIAELSRGGAGQLAVGAPAVSSVLPGML